MKPLFIPLKRKYFEAFERGEKRFEYRRYGSRWNETTCIIGRSVTLSLGYGKARRLSGRIVTFSKQSDPEQIPGWIDCYGEDSSAAAVIGIELMEHQGR